MGMKLLVMQVTRQVSHCESLYTPPPPAPPRRKVKGDNVLELKKVVQFPGKQMFRTFWFNVIASALCASYQI